MCAAGKPKEMVFVSSTSVLDTDHYLKGSMETPLSEDDELVGSEMGLHTGYGQSKWVCEGLMRDAGKRGLRGAIVRPGYVTGESKMGTTITDDFLVRILKGCDQIHSYPDLGSNNYINMMPVDGVAKIIVAASSSAPEKMCVLNATARSMTFNDYLGTLSAYGYNVSKVPYEAWTTWLQDYVETTVKAERTEHALLPLYHLAVTDLPNDSRSPLLDNANVQAVLKHDAENRNDVVAEVADKITEELVGRYLSYLCEIGFIEKPKSRKGKSLPKVEISKEQREALAKIGGRGAVA